MTDELFYQRIADLLGPSGLVADPGGMAPYLEEERGLFHGKARLVARPASTGELAELVKICAEAGIAIVPQGGNTGLCGGASPSDATWIVVSLARMNKIRAIDPVNFTMTVESGVILQTVQSAALSVDCLFPLSLGAEGSCQIGGNISTNAGGTGVLRYGNMRDLVLGLEVVLPDGRIWDGLKSLRKDNTGYDLKQLYIGGEGTLGIITAAVLKLYPRARDQQTAFCALKDLPSSLALLSRARNASGDQVTGFELVPRLGLTLGRALVPGVSDPFADPHEWYALIELSSSRVDAGLTDMLETLLGEAVVASSLEQRKALWKIREGIPEAQKKAGGSIKHDVAVPVADVPVFIDRASRAVEAAMAGVRVVPFGHVGDGNIHFNLTQPEGADKQAFLDRWEEMNRIVHDIVVAMKGSISAEHGIGRLKKGELTHYKSAVEIELMRRIKEALDPQGIMNPGNVL
jgi:D-lactate dehydrogenase (cytochrome)